MADAARCVLCCATENTLIRTGARYAPEVEVRQCDACGLVFLSPLPSEDDLSEYYASTYVEEYEASDLEARFRENTEDARARVHRLESQLRPSTRLLEIGAGSGAFLRAVEPHVGTLVAVEPDTACRDWITGRLSVPAYATLEEIPGELTFDVIVAFHVLEHLLDPVGFLARLRPLVAEGGRLVIEVPNLDDALVGAYRVPSYLSFYFQGAHLTYFAEPTLRRAFERAAFTVEVTGVQRYDLSNHMRWMLTGEPGGAGYYRDLFTEDLERVYAEALIRSGRSDTLWAEAVPRHDQGSGRAA